MGAYGYRPTWELLRDLRAGGAPRNFIETGSFLGATTAFASSLFPEVHTVESNPGLFEAVRRRFASSPHVTCHPGHSPEVLETLLSGLTERAVILLDAHWCGGQPTEGGDCPLLEELDAIAGDGRDHVVIVDDAHLFLSPARPPMVTSEFPGLLEVLRRLDQLPQSHVTVFDDMIVRVPESMKSVIVRRSLDGPPAVSLITLLGVQTKTWLRRTLLYRRAQRVKHFVAPPPGADRWRRASDV
jgi:hypothetical protein